ncbi:MAG: TonB-dependent receptor, partial [Desulfobacterales bacterium]
KRIEVIRGPASALYGANAFMGLVNIITKSADDVNGIEATARLGSFSMQQYNLQFGKSFNDLKIFANANFFDEDGFEAYVEQDADYGNPGTKAPGYNHEWGKSHDIDLKLEYKNLKLRIEEYRREDGPYFGGVNAINDEDHSLYKDNFVELAYTYEASSNLDFSAKIYRDYLSFDNVWELHSEGYESEGVVYPDGQIVVNGLTNTKLGGELLATFRTKDVNTFIFGGMFEKHKQFDVTDRFNGLDNTGEKWAPDVSRELWAIFAEDLYDIRDNLRLTVGLRYDHYSDFGGVLNPRAGIGWEFIENYDLKIMYGQAFRAPTFAEVYNENLLVGGNRDLDPEKIKTYEISFGAVFNAYLSGRITGFHNDIDNLIENIAGDTQNSGEVESNGVEFEIKADIKNGSYLKANYTYVRAENKNDDSKLPDIPSHRGYIAANINLSKQFNFYMDLYLKDDMPRTEGDTRGDLSGYAISNATLIAKNLAPKIDGLELRGSVYNIFDKEYADPAPLGRNIPGDYPMPGRTFVVEAKFKF